MNAIKEKAYAKINLFLDVCSKREDGFHDIKTVMHTVSLFDEITVAVTPAKKRSIKIKVAGTERVPYDSRNLAYLAAQKYLDVCGIECEINITLNKTIPVSSGLAGGSADAAATLRALNRIFRKRLTDKALLNIAESIGSDVPFCLIGGTALCEGRGELITRLKDNLDLYAVIATTKEYISTPLAYKTLDELYNNFDGSVNRRGDIFLPEFSASIKNGGTHIEGLYNIFEEAVLPSCQAASFLRKRMIELGAYTSLMSGSGPSVFGLFYDKQSANKAAEILLGEGVNACSVNSVFKED